MKKNLIIPHIYFLNCVANHRETKIGLSCNLKEQRMRNSYSVVTHLGNNTILLHYRPLSEYSFTFYMQDYIMLNYFYIWQT